MTIRKERIKQLNRRIFRRNLKKVLHPAIVESIAGMGLENWVEDYRQRGYASGRWGWYEVSSSEHKHGHAEEIRTN